MVIAASEAGTTPVTAATAAVEGIELSWGASPSAVLHPEDYYDFQVTRPTIHRLSVEPSMRRRRPARAGRGDDVIQRVITLLSGLAGTLRGMTDEVSVIGPVEVDVEGLRKLAGHAAITPAEPVEAVYLRDDGRPGRVAAVHAFTAAGSPLVLGKRGLVEAWSATGERERFDHIRPRSVGPGPAVGPFTPAPPGLVAKVGDTTMAVLYFDLHGRPVLVDDDPLSRELYLAAEDEQLESITGIPLWPATK